MKLVRYGQPGKERPGLLDRDGALRDLGGVVDDVDGSVLAPHRLRELQSLNVETLPLVPGAVRLGPCVARPGKFLCIGLNYADHAAETGAAIPAEPIVFMKATSALSGPNDAVIQPRGSTKLDWEVELAFVIGTECRYVDEAAGAAAIAGYFVATTSPREHFNWSAAASGTRAKAATASAPSVHGS